MEAIKIRNLKKNYGKHRGVTDLSFQVEEGDIYGFLGPNGAGKSTTIRSMLGLIHYDAGSIQILGKDAKEEQQEILKNVGYMPSEAMFYSEMRVEQVIRFAADNRKLDCSREARFLCEKLQLDTSKRISELSLGNRKKVSIVCAMQHKPKLLIFDEPTSGLDPLMQDAFFELVLKYNQQGTTCFLSSHVLSEVKKYCHNVVIIKEGELVLEDSVEHLTQSDIRKIRVTTDVDFSQENGISKYIRRGKEQQFIYAASMQRLLEKLQGRKVEDLLIEEPDMEEIFMHFYRKDEETV